MIHNLSRGLFLALLSLTVPAIFGQTVTTGDVGGSVNDPTGAVVAGAAVTLRGVDTGETRTASTTDSGTYRFTFVKPGNYTLTATSAGLRTDIVHVEVQVGQVASVTLVARVQAASPEIVEVSADGSRLQTEDANLTATYNSNQIQNLPAAGGDLSTVAFSVPGVVINVGSGFGYGNFSSHGLPGTSNLFVINGNDYNDPYLNLNNSGASNLTLGSNEIQEASVIQNAYSAQYGRQAGAQVNYVTKSGTNSFHGNLNYNWNGAALNANDFFNNANGVGRPHAVSNEYAASIGGRVIKDKLFFFADTEGIRYVLPTSGVVTVPSAQLQNYILGNIASSQQSLYQTAFHLWNNAPGNGSKVAVTNGPGPLQDGSGSLGCGTLTGTSAPGGGVFGTNVSCANAWGANGSNQNSEYLYTFRGDYNISDRQKLNARFKHDRGQQPTETSLVSPVFNVQSVQPQYEGQFNYTFVVSPTMVNNFIGSALWYSALFQSASISSVLQAFPTNFFIRDGGSNGSSAFTGAGFTQAGFGAGGFGFNLFPQGRRTGQAQLTDDFSIVAGSHTIKLGANLRKNRVTDMTLLESVYGSYTFNSLVDFANASTNAQTGSAYVQAFPSIDAAHLRFYNLGVYAQDEWNAKPNLKVTIGLRLDNTGNPYCTDKCFARLSDQFSLPSFQKGIDIPYNQSILSGLGNAYASVDAVVPQPRLGVVWSPKGKNSTVIRGGIGLFADLAPGGLAPNVFLNTPNSFVANIFNNAPVGSSSNPNSAESIAIGTANAFKSGFSAGDTLAQLNQLLATTGGFAPPNYYSIARRLVSPKYMEWSFEVEQPIGLHNVFSVTYSGNHGYDLLTQNGFVNANVNTQNFPNGFGGLPVTQPDPRFNAITEITNSGRSNYNGLSLQFRRNFSYGFQGQIGYTWSHALDTISNGGAGEYYSVNNAITTLSSPNAQNNYSNADYDIRHSLVADFVWDTPWKFGNRGLNYALSGWTLSGRVYVRSGSPFSITDSQIEGLVSTAIQPNVQNGVGPMLASYAVANVPRNCGSGAVDTPCFSPSDFVIAGQETGFGNVARNSIYGPHYFNTETALYKRFAITEHIGFTLGASAYNLLNHPNFGNPGANVAAPGLGSIGTTAIPPTSAYGTFQGSAVSGRVLVLTGRFSF